MSIRESTGGRWTGSTLPAPWRPERTLRAALRGGLGRAPWLGLALAGHLLVAGLLVALPWDLLRTEAPPALAPELAAPPALPPELAGPPELAALPEPPPRTALLAASRQAGERFGDRSDVAALGGAGVRETLDDGLEWLSSHQSPDGSWDCDGFSASCKQRGAAPCGGAGGAAHDVGVTGLALLAFLGDGNTTEEGRYREAVARGLEWLSARQDPQSGLFGDRASGDFIYDHAIATLAVCEAYCFTQGPALKGTAQRAIDFIGSARNPFASWRYDVPPSGQNDTSVTGWMIFALAAAKDGGLRVDDAALEGGLAWIDEVSDPATGRVGYDSLSSFTSRPPDAHFPRERSEAMTAVGLFCRIFLGQDPREQPILEQHADLLRRALPVWDPGGFGCDMYYWYYGTYAMFQMGGNYWKTWNAAMKTAVLDSQRRDGDERGSWDPVCPWGYAGGRVYSTALMSLCLEVYFRYTRLLAVR